MTMDAFGVTAPMDFDTRLLLADVKSKPGLHYEYQYGYKRNDEVLMRWPDPKYPGCTVRIFLYADKLSKGFLWVIYDFNRFVRVAFNDTEGTVTFAEETKNGRERTLNNKLKAGTHFSIAVRMEEDRYLRGLWDREEFQLHDMKKLSGSKWDIQVETGEVFLTSFHLYDEKNNLPVTGLGTVYDVTPLIMYIGSIVTVVAVFTGNRNDIITISFKQTSGADVAVNFPSVSLGRNEEFKIIIENTVRGWQVAASFLGNAQNASIAARRSNEEYIVPMFSRNCYIKKIFGVCGAITSDYRFDT